MMVANKYIDLKFLNLISSRLRNFKWKKQNLANCSCPLCGDSKVDERKARGYFFFKDNRLMFKCHNCGVGVSFNNFLKSFDGSVLKSYILEKYKQTPSNNVEKDFTYIDKSRLISKQERLKQLQCINTLPSNHKARLYVENRQIPKQHHKILYHCNDFRKYIESINEESSKNLVQNEQRLIIPFFDENNIVFAVQGRDYNPKSKMRYITIKFEDKQKIYGLERIKFNQKIYVVEGPIDSLFLPNCLAMAGSDLCNLQSLPKENSVFIFDNEPRNKELHYNIDKIIENDYNVSFIPDKYRKYGKDINEMVKSGLTQEEIISIIDGNTHRGLRAKLEFNNWKKTSGI